MSNYDNSLDNEIRALTNYLEGGVLHDQDAEKIRQRLIDIERYLQLEEEMRQLADNWREDLAVATYAGQAVEKCANDLRSLADSDNRPKQHNPSIDCQCVEDFGSQMCSSCPADERDDAIELRSRICHVLENIITDVENADMEELEYWALGINGFLEEMRTGDFFGTEGQNDPRGDFRNENWSVFEPQDFK